MADPWAEFRAAPADPWEAFRITKGESGVRGAAQGVTLGNSDEMAALGAQSFLPGAEAGSKTTLGNLGIYDVAAGALKKLFSGDAGKYQKERDRQRAANETARKANPWSYGLGQAAGAVATAIPTASLAAAPTLAGQVGRGAALGAGYGAAQSAGDAKELTDVPGDAAKGGAIGGLVGGAIPLALAGMRRAVSPFPVNSPDRQRLVDALRNEGVDLTAGQAAGSKPLMWTESTLSDLPFGGGAAFSDRQKEQFTAAALRRSGETANRATPEVMDRALTRMGAEFDRLASNNKIIPDQKLGQDLAKVFTNYESVTGASSRAPIILKKIQDLAEAARSNGGAIPGKFYQSFRSEIDRVARETSAPELQTALYGLRSAVDDAMERGLAASNSPDLGAWRAVRNQYRNFLPIESAATGAGSETAQGLLSPSQLRTAVKAQNIRSYARGNGDLAELARAGEAIMRPLPNSGTMPRTFYGGLVGGSTAMLGPQAILYALLGPAAGRALTSQPVARALNNQLLAGTASNQTQRLVNALIAQPSVQKAIEKEKRR